MRTRLALLVPLLCLLALAFPTVAAAHPLGNFTINRYARLEVHPGLIRIRYVMDEAEIPTYQDLALLHPGGKPTGQEEQGFLRDRVEQLREHLRLTVDGQQLPVDLEPGSATLSFPPGQGGLPLLRVTAWFRAAVPAPTPASVAQVSFRDDNYDDRLGWKEIVVRAGDGAVLSQSSVTAVDQSDELRAYPQDMLSSPLDVRSAEFSFRAAPSGATPAADLLQPRGRGAGLLQAATDAFTALVSRRAITFPFLLFALLAAVALGGVHALSPGHGKTIVGAYLVGSRGTARHAAILGLTVTVTHTAGVFALGLVTLFASHYVVPERLYPWLSTISGLLVAAVGAWLLLVRLRAVWQRRIAAAIAPHPLVPADGEGLAAAPAEHGHEHAHGHGESDHQHRHNDSPAHHHAGAPVIEHQHGGGRHRHVLPAAGPITGRGLVAIGISGGLLPCPSALVVLLAAIALHRIAFGILLVVAFSTGLAGVITAIGLVLVYAQGFFARFPLQVGPGRLLPAASAAAVLALGLVITLQALGQAGLL